MSRAAGLIITVACLAGCSGWFGNRYQQPELPLLPPQDYWLQQSAEAVSAVAGQKSLEESIQRSHRVSVTFQGKQQTLLAAWTVSESRVVFVGLTPTGQRLLTLNYDGVELLEDFSPLMTDTFPARDVLAQLQLAHWPEQSILQGYADSPWQPQLQPGCRELYLNERLVLSVALMSDGGCGDSDRGEVSNSDIVVQHFWVNFELTVTSLD